MSSYLKSSICAFTLSNIFVEPLFGGRSVGRGNARMGRLPAARRCVRPQRRREDYHLGRHPQAPLFASMPGPSRPDRTRIHMQRHLGLPGRARCPSGASLWPLRAIHRDRARRSSCSPGDAPAALWRRRPGVLAPAQPRRPHGAPGVRRRQATCPPACTGIAWSTPRGRSQSDSSCSRAAPPAPSHPDPKQRTLASQRLVQPRSEPRGACPASVGSHTAGALSVHY